MFENRNKKPKKKHVKGVNLLMLRAFCTYNGAKITDLFTGELLTEGSDQVEIVAIKVLKENATREAEEDFIREVEIMSAFRHDNILSLLGMVVRGN